MTQNIDDLEAFLTEERDARVYKRALAVKMALNGYLYDVICDILHVSPGFISQWKKAYTESGIEGLRLNYHGPTPFLGPNEKQAVITWLHEQQTWDLEQLKTHIEATYGIVFQSRQSYYDLLAEAKITWKKAQRANPHHNPALVAAKKKEISERLEEWHDAIIQRDLVVLYLDECHVVWDDARGYVWGPAGQRIAIEMTNFRERQTYYGAIEHMDGEVTVAPYPAGNGDHTVAFLHLLQQKYAGKRLVLLWDGATYHKGAEMQTYLQNVNAGLDPDEWQVICIVFAPNAPEQNPMEDIWLKAKQFVRKNWHKCNIFSKVKEIFLNSINNQSFDFKKLHMYADL
jgi:transposase